MAMLKPSQSHTVGVIVDPYTGNIAQELQFLSGEDRKKKEKNNPILRLGCPWQAIFEDPVNPINLLIWWKVKAQGVPH